MNQNRKDTSSFQIDLQDEIQNSLKDIYILKQGLSMQLRQTLTHYVTQADLRIPGDFHVSVSRELGLQMCMPLHPARPARF